MRSLVLLGSRPFLEASPPGPSGLATGRPGSLGPGRCLQAEAGVVAEQPLLQGPQWRRPRVPRELGGCSCLLWLLQCVPLCDTSSSEKEQKESFL